MNSLSGIYAIRHVSGAVYIGSSKNLATRFCGHARLLNKGRHHASKLQALWDRDGAEAFTYQQLEMCALEQLLSREQYHIDLAGDALLNGSRVADSPSSDPAVARKLSAVHTGVKLSIAHRRAQSEGMKGRVHSLEARAAWRRANLGRKASPETKLGISEALAGRQLSAEHRAAISRGLVGKQVGKIISAEQRAKISATLTWRKASPETRAKLSIARRGNQNAAGMHEWRHERLLALWSAA